MGTFSIWHWLIVLVYFVVVPVTAIVLAKKDKTLARLPYLYRLIAIFVVGMAGKFVGEQTVNLGVFVVLVCVFLFMWLLQYLWAVHRTQDIGWSKWWVLLTIIPLVNVVYIFVILFVPRRKAEISDAAAS